jgi:hypothetical protein
VGAQLLKADAISSLAFLPINAADRFIVVYVGSIAGRLSKMPAQPSLTLRDGLFWNMFTILSEAYLHRKAADSTIIDHSSCIAT